MRFHLPALPGQPVTRENSICAFTQKVRKFAEMMVPRGHEVIIYGDPEYDVNTTEYVPCYPSCNPPPFNPAAWGPFNQAALEEIRKRAEPKDFLGIMGGLCQKYLTDNLNLLASEYGIGYAGCYHDFKVFESYAWMHTVYGQQRGSDKADGSFFDAVIPAYFDKDDTVFQKEKEDYLLFIGRMTQRKGVQVAVDTAKHLGAKLLLAGAGEFEPEYGEVLGPVGPDERWKLMAGAKAVFAPTLYIEPFGCVAVEAQLCGTPAITTDWGAFVETVEDGVTGNRCRTLAEFVAAIENLDALASSQEIRDRAVRLYTYDTLAPEYEKYFERLSTLRNKGWYELHGVK